MEIAERTQIQNFTEKFRRNFHRNQKYFSKLGIILRENGKGNWRIHRNSKYFGKIQRYFKEIENFRLFTAKFSILSIFLPNCKFRTM